MTRFPRASERQGVVAVSAIQSDFDATLAIFAFSRILYYIRLACSDQTARICSGRRIIAIYKPQIVCCPASWL